MSQLPPSQFERDLPAGAAPPKARMYTIEVMSGFCIACMLTLSFTSPLSATAKVSLCFFCGALPIFAGVRVQLRYGQHPGPWLDYLLIAAIVLAIVGLTLLMWAVFWPAAIVLIASGAIVLGLLFAAWYRWGGGGRMG